MKTSKQPKINVLYINPSVTSSRSAVLCLAILTLLIFLITLLLFPVLWKELQAPSSQEEAKTLIVPTPPSCEDILVPYDLTVEQMRTQLNAHGVKVVLWVYYGRRMFAEISEYWLSTNLRKNGGIIDTVMWFLNTNVKEDLAFLASRVLRHPEHYVPIPMQGGFRHRLWDELKPNVVYIKSDDDIVYIHPGAIEAIVYEKYMFNRFFLVSANVINHPILSYYHQQLDLIKGHSEISPKVWYPINNRSDKIWDREPFGQCSLASQHCATELHMSFIADAMKGEALNWNFGIVDLHLNDNYRRWSINFFAFMASDFGNEEIKEIMQSHDDEKTLSKEMPERIKRHAGSCGPGIVAHFGYAPQRGNGLLAKTKVLDSYRQLAGLPKEPELVDMKLADMLACVNQGKNSDCWRN